MLELINTPEYGWVILVSMWLCFQCWIFGFVYGEFPRTYTFTKDFLNKNFGKEHKEMTGSEFSRWGGYPDMGDGKYGQKLSYSQWFLYSCNQRIHHNYLEQLTPILILTLANGLFFPKAAAYLGVLYIVGRQIVACGYGSVKGAYHPLRIIGISFADISLVFNFLMVNYGFIQSLSNN